jgi:hypothetical protein
MFGAAPIEQSPSEFLEARAFEEMSDDTVDPGSVVRVASGPAAHNSVLH